MEEFIQSFIDEATESLNKVELALMQLEAQPNNMDLINEIFRSIHSLKGSGAMFGFSNVSEFVHDLESIYDALRNKSITIDSSLIDLTLKSVDHIKNLLRNNDKFDDQSVDQHSYLLGLIEYYIKVYNIQIHTKTITQNVETPKNNIGTFLIRFSPNETALISGAKPHFTLDEIFELGSAIAFFNTSKMPDWESFCADMFYMEWYILLYTTQGEDSINDTLEFAKCTSEIEVSFLTEDNLLKKNAYIKHLSEYFEKNINNPLNYSCVKNLANEFINVHCNEVEITETETKSDTQDEIAKETYAKLTRNDSQSLRVTLNKIDKHSKLISELITMATKMQLKMLDNTSTELQKQIKDIVKISKGIQDSLLDIRSIPLQDICTRLQRLTRDLARKLNKQIVFFSSGTDIELDKSVIDALEAPLMHLIRNCVDHGIETPDVREKSGKNRKGRIDFDAKIAGSDIVISIKDDGYGINVDNVRTKATNLNIIKEEDKLDETEILQLVFLPGLSTSKELSDISGRGVGLDVVKNSIRNLYGHITVQSTKNVGTEFLLKIPLRYKKVLLINSNNNTFALPYDYILQNKTLPFRDFLRVCDGWALVFNNQVVPIVSLKSILVNNEDEFDEYNQDRACKVIVVQTNIGKMAIVVDKLEGTAEVTVLPMPDGLEDLQNYSGVCILGNGNIALLLDPDNFNLAN